MKPTTLFVIALALLVFVGEARAQMGDLGTAATDAAKQQAQQAGQNAVNSAWAWRPPLRPLPQPLLPAGTRLRKTRRQLLLHQPPLRRSQRLQLPQMRTLLLAPQRRRQLQPTLARRHLPPLPTDGPDSRNLVS
jgi:hypothetical protein